MNVAILVPTLGRPERLAPLVHNAAEATPEGVYHLIFVVDAHDVPTWQALTPLADRADVLLLRGGGTYAEKTNAGADAARATGAELVVPTADDIAFHPGWYEAALPHFEAGAQLVGTNDLTPATRGGRHATMPIVSRSYIDGPGAVWGESGKVFWEGYHHNFVETELWQLANHRGVADFEPESVIEHCHPAWGTREADETDAKGNQQGWEQDKARFESRKAQWLAS